MVLPNDPTRAHVLYGRVDIYHEVLAGLGVDKLLGVPKHFFISARGTAHGLGPSLNRSGRMLTTGKAALAHAERLVLDVDAEVVAGLGMTFRRRVDPALS